MRLSLANILITDAEHNAVDILYYSGATVSDDFSTAHINIVSFSYQDKTYVCNDIKLQLKTNYPNMYWYEYQTTMQYPPVDTTWEISYVYIDREDFIKMHKVEPKEDIFI